MNKQMRDNAQRRSELLAKIAAQRQQVREASARWQAPLAVADKGIAAARYLRAHPLLLAGVVALLAVRRGGVIGMASNAWRLWRWYTSAKQFAAKILPRS